MMSTLKNSCFMGRALALAAVLGAGVAMSAQTAATTPDAFASQTLPAVSLQSPEPAFSSSVTESDNTAAPVEAFNVKPFNFVNAMQYGSGRSGRPRYRGGNTNADGSNRWIFFGGAGFTQPIGNTWHYFTPSWGIQVGGGRQFSSKFAVPIQFDYDNFGMTGQTLANQLALYTILTNQYNATTTGQANPATPPNPLDGNMHVWSFTIDPTETFYQTDTWGAYAVEGVGFYHKVSTFLTPQSEEYCDPYYGICEPVEVNGTYDHYTSNAPGFSGGFGLTYKFSRFSSERFYGEVRYVYMLNSQRQGITLANANSNPLNFEVANDFQYNSNRTSYFPVKFGIRF